MKIKRIIVTVLLACVLTLVGCNSTQEKSAGKRDTIPFADDQLYAVAFLGYEEIEDLTYYKEQYLDDESLPIHYFSNGEYYLIIPRYDDMSVRLYRNDLDTMDKMLVYESDSSNPFIIQCNISDIFFDVTVELTYQGETVEFSPYISLMDGSVIVGEKGLNVTK